MFDTMSGTANGITIADPRDGTTVGTIVTSEPDEVRAAVRRAADAAREWSRTPAADRGETLRRAAQALEERADALAELEERETGRHREQALGGVKAAISTLFQQAELAALHRGRSLLGAGEALDLMRPEARGVAAVVTPWNDPVAVSAGLIGAALATGNTVVHKPSERCPHLGRMLGEVLEPVFPPGVLNTVIGGPDVGEVLVSSVDIDVVAHVGSTLAGERIARAVALTGAHLIRENGGNDPLIVDAGVDVAWAASEAARGAFTNSGQLCTGVERIFVHQDIAEAFVDALAREADALNEAQALSPLVDERMRDHVHAHVSSALEDGARLVTGGVVPAGPGCRYPATVLADCSPAMTVFREETFGPVAPVLAVRDFDHALELACDDQYGLAATVLTTDSARALRAAERLPVGTVKINDVFGGAPGGAAQPRRRSGAGFGYGPELLDEMTRVKVIHMQAGVPA